VKQGWVVVTFRAAIVPEQRMDTQGRLGTQKTTQKTAQKTTQKIIQIIMKNPHVTRKELADSIGITNDGIKYHLTKMQKKGLLRRIGPDKGGHWASA